MKPKLYWWRTIASFLFVLFMMPLGHASMIIMEKNMGPDAVHVGGFLLGLAGLVMVIWGVFVKGDTKQTLFGLIGALFFWTGWVEFLFQYYAHRYGTMPEMENGVVVTKPEYLILPATFGLWGHDDARLYVLHKNRLRPHQLAAKAILPQPQERDCTPSYVAPRGHNHIHGVQYDYVDKLSFAHVLL